MRVSVSCLESGGFFRTSLVTLLHTMYSLKIYKGKAITSLRFTGLNFTSKYASNTSHDHVKGRGIFKWLLSIRSKNLLSRCLRNSHKHWNKAAVCKELVG